MLCHDEVAATGGHSKARHKLSNFEGKAGRIDRALKSETPDDISQAGDITSLKAICGRGVRAAAAVVTAWQRKVSTLLT